MPRTNTAPTKLQQEAIKRAGESHPLAWKVLQDLEHSLIIRHMLTGEVRRCGDGVYAKMPYLRGVLGSGRDLRLQKKRRPGAGNTESGKEKSD